MKLSSVSSSVSRRLLRVQSVEYAEVRDIVLTKHYLRRNPYKGKLRAYKITIEGNAEHGALVFGMPCFHSKRGFMGAGEPYANGEVSELLRMWLPDSFPHGSASCAVAKAIKLLRTCWPGLRAVLAMSDTEVGHTGGVYKACNFTHLGSIRGNAHRAGEAYARKNDGVRKEVYLYPLDEVNIPALRAAFGKNARFRAVERADRAAAALLRSISARTDLASAGCSPPATQRER